VKQEEYFQIFLAESREHLFNIRHWLSVLSEQPGDRPGLDALFRSVHSIKGMAASMGFRRLADMAHAMEDGLDRLRRTGQLPPGALGQLYGGAELLEQRLNDVASGKSDAEAGDNVFGQRPDRLRKLRITMPGARASHWLLLVNELMRLGTLRSCHPGPETIANGDLPAALEVELFGPCDREELVQRCRNVFDAIGIAFVSAPDMTPSWSIQHGSGDTTVRVATGLLDRFVGLTGELLTVRHRLQEALQGGRQEEIDGSCQQLDRLLAALRRQVIDARMVPVESVRAPLVQLVRELCRTTGKDVRLNLVGTEECLDRSILEALSEPLMHMVRNAVDHGIEKTGTITISARRDRDRIALDFSDDGRGFDPEFLSDRARKSGFSGAAGGGGMTSADILRLICSPGFSTARHITGTSGRGIGMDVVRHTVDRLGGSLEILSGPGEGAHFRFILPLTVSIVPVLLVEAGGLTVGLPPMWIEKTLDVPADAIRYTAHGAAAGLGDRNLPIFFLSDLLGTASARNVCSAIVCELRGGHAGLVVDAVLGQKEVFVKPLTFPLDRIRGLSGATILGDGRVIFLLDPCALLSGFSGTAIKGETL